MNMKPVGRQQVVLGKGIVVCGCLAIQSSWVWESHCKKQLGVGLPTEPNRTQGISAGFLGACCLTLDLTLGTPTAVEWDFDCLQEQRQCSASEHGIVTCWIILSDHS